MAEIILDPDDSEQMNRLADFLGTFAEEMTVALRKFAEPEHVRPDEPTEIGAWVTDGEGQQWHLLPPSVRYTRWASWGGSDKVDHDWADLPLPITIGSHGGVPAEREPEPVEDEHPDLIDRDNVYWSWYKNCEGYRPGSDGSHGQHDSIDGRSRFYIENQFGPITEVKPS